jgi:methionyl-tRNA formyltransferase
MDVTAVFMGSPEFALPSLEALAGVARIVGVVTQPDRPSGRGKQLNAPPVKLLAEQMQIPVIQPQRMREPGAVEQLQAWNPDLIVVVAFGQILRANVLDLPRYGCINVHASLLPRWRGAAPIQAAILHGDAQSGVSIMRLDPGIDTGPLLAQRATDILPEDTAESLSQRLAVLGAELLLETVPGYLEGSITPQPQAESGASYAAMMKKEDGALDFSHTAAELERRVRAYYPWPGTYTTWEGQMFKILRAHPHAAKPSAPGRRGMVDGLPAISAADGWLVLDEVQPAGKKPMPGDIFLRGARDWADG